MLSSADAALVIGDPALRVDPRSLPFRWLDLGVEWWELTGLPMVFAIWAARPGLASAELAEAFRDSLSFGMEHMDEIVRSEAAGRGFGEPVVRDYLARNVVFTFGDAERRGLERFLALAGDSGILEKTGA
jgi:predicted solute-binding protein